jgi:hypothetical protein
MMVDRNSPVQVACPHCKNAGAKLLPPLGDRDDYRCPNCGDFGIDGTQGKRFKEGLVDPTNARFIQAQGRRWLKE